MLEFQILVSTIAGPGVMFAIIAICSVVVITMGHTKDFYRISASGVMAICITFTLKHILQIPRSGTMLIVENSYRFPSGHATIAAVVATLGIYYSHRYIKQKAYRYMLYAVSLLWFVLVSYSRLYLRAHIPIDIVAGGLIGLGSTLIILQCFKHLHYYK